LPFGRLSIHLDEARRLPAFVDLASLEQSRLWLQDALNEASGNARRMLGLIRKA
jgi:hypothetical protein